MGVGLRPVREVDVLRLALERIEDCLPSNWTITVSKELVTDLFGRLDAIITLTPPRGRPIALAAAVKLSVATRDLLPVVEQLASASRAASGRSKPILLVVARYIPPPLQEWLTEREVSYADATGNLRIVSDTPTVFLRDVGAARDPWRGPGRPRGSLKGEPAARVVRALVDFSPPMTVPELIKLSRASSGATYRVVEFLEKQALLERSPRGPIERVSWARLLRAWAKDYDVMTTNTMRTFLQPRGLPALADGLRSLEAKYALTGSLAAQFWAPYAQARVAMIYADDPDDVARDLGLREVETGANVLLGAPAYDVVFERLQLIDGLTVTTPSQVVADLLTSPGRGPAEGQALLEWMENNVDEWRRRPTS